MTVPGDGGAEAAELPGREIGGGWHRMHPLTPLLKGGLALLVIFGVIVANLRDTLIELFLGEQYSDGYGGAGVDDLLGEVVANGWVLAVIGGILAFFLLIVFFSWLSWRFHSYRITDDAVENREGVIVKKHRRAPLERIQAVNLQRPLLARLLGLTKIDVQTAGQDGTVELSYLGHRDAKTVRETILRSAARSRGLVAPVQSPAAPTASPAAPSSAAHASPDDPTARAEATGVPAVSPTGTAYAPAAGGLERRMQDFADFDIDPAARGEGILVSVPIGRLLGSLAASTETLVMLAMIIAVVCFSVFGSPVGLVGLLPIVIASAGMLIGKLNTGFNFTLSRSSEGVRTSSGLTATNTDTLPLGRIHAVEALQPIGWRVFGWWKVRINVAGFSVAQAGQNARRNVVLPVGTAADVLRVLEALLPGIGDDPDEVARLRDALDGDGSGFLRAGPMAGAVLWFGRRRAGMQLATAPSRPDRAGVASAAVDVDVDATVRIRRGAVTRSLIVMPVVRAQSVQFRRPLVHRLLGLATLQMHTVLGPVRVEMRGIGLAEARAQFEALAAAVVAVQGADADRRPRGEGAEA